MNFESVGPRAHTPRALAPRGKRTINVRPFLIYRSAESAGIGRQFRRPPPPTAHRPPSPVAVPVNKCCASAPRSAIAPPPGFLGTRALLQNPSRSFVSRHKLYFIVTRIPRRSVPQPPPDAVIIGRIARVHLLARTAADTRTTSASQPAGMISTVSPIGPDGGHNTREFDTRVPSFSSDRQSR